MFEWIADPAIWLSLATLTLMEIILGIDNVVFISVITSRLPAEMRKRARQIGLLGALGFRILFLLFLTWIIGLTAPVFSLGITGPLDAAGHPSFETDFSWRDIILFAGGLFLLIKATLEIHAGVEAAEEDGHGGSAGRRITSFGAAVTQIMIIDIVFSIDSIITAIGMAEVVGVMIAAVIIAVGVMYIAAGPVSEFIHRNPTTKMLALAFLFMIGAALIADALGFHIPRAYLYTAMAFSAIVEILNVRARRNRDRRSAAAIGKAGEGH